MKRIYVLIIIIYGLILLALTTRNGALLAFSLPFLIYLALGLIFGPETLQLQVTRTLSADRVYPGTPVQVTLTILNQGANLEKVLITDRIPKGLEIVDGNTCVLTTLKAGGSAVLQYSIRGPRGQYRLDTTHFAASDHLGIHIREDVCATTERLFILPEVWRLRRIAIKPPRTRIYSGFIPTRRGGPGVEFYGIREYQQGDPLRWINWNASARRKQTYIVNQFEQERVAEIVIILDARKKAEVKSDDGDNIFEHSVRAAASLADTFIKDGNRVGLLSFGMTHLDWAFPGYGKVQREKIMQTLAKAKPAESQVFRSFENLPVRLFHPHTQLFIISPLPKGDHNHIIRLCAMGYSILMVSPDPVSFVTKNLDKSDSARIIAARLARIERTLMINCIRQARIHVLDWNVSSPLERTMHISFNRILPDLHTSRINL